MVIEDNYFHIAGAAILIEGDANYWYEQSGVRDVVIRRNLFENGNYGSPGWGSACIAVGSGIPDRETSPLPPQHPGRGQHLPRVRPAYRQPLLCRRVRVHAGQCNRIYR